MDSFKVGVFPSQVPRDPIEINTFLEHMLAGQVLDTLISSDQFGNIIPSIAKSWAITKGGTQLDFIIDEKIKFSNGKSVTAKDVKYSIDRHIKSSSQSKSYLNSIQSIDVLSEKSIRILLKEPRIAIFKVLSRDQLGIVPEGWVFKSASPEPYIGTGPYRIEKKGERLFLSLNEHYHLQVPRLKWELIIGSASMNEVQQINYIPFITRAELDKLVDVNKLNLDKFSVNEQLSFLQSSAWWYPHGNHYANQDAKSYAMFVVNSYIDQRAKKLKLKRATSVIPEGIAGYLKTLPSITLKSKSSKLAHLKVAIFASIYDEYFDPEIIKAIEKEYGVKISFLKVEMSKPEVLIQEKPDVFIARWAGGFNDPEGFLAILDQMLSIPFTQYLGKLENLYIEGKKEQDWSKRNIIFSDLATQLVTNLYMVPGWKTPTFTVTSKNMQIQNIGFRYTPRFSDVELKVNGK